jgi:hypothetical protein
MRGTKAKEWLLRLKILAVTKLKYNCYGRVQGDDTYVYEFTPGYKRNSMTWKHPIHPIQKKIKTSVKIKKW